MPPFPERIGRYELLLPIAAGGAGTVYLARSIGLAGFEREVALKLTHAQLREDPHFAHSLIQEATIAGRIRHPNVVPVLDVDEDPFGVFLVMEYVEGEALSGLVKLADAAGGQVPERIALTIVADVLEGLEAAHDLTDTDGTPLGLVHRDVTPHNVLVGVDGIARLTDFGIAKATTRVGLTATGRIKGKVAYMSPEQALGRSLDASTDLWAVGVILWELMTGVRLHVGTSDAATLLRIVSEPPLSASTFRPDLPYEIDALISHALTMNRLERPSSAAAFAAELEAAAAATWGRASRHEVAAWVRELVAERLALRRSKIDEVIELRGRLGQLGRVALGSSPSAAPSAPTITGVGIGPDAATRMDRLSVPDPISAPNSAPEATRTETASVTSLKARTGRSRMRWAPVIAAVVTLALIGVAAAALHHSAPAASVSAVVAPTAPASLALEPSASAPPATASDSPAVEPSDLPLSPDELPLLPSAKPPARVHAHRAIRHARSTHKPAPAVTIHLDTTPQKPEKTGPGLLGSPYEKDNE
jgi:serine/threonine-protein kinase